MYLYPINPDIYKLQGKYFCPKKMKEILPSDNTPKKKKIGAKIPRMTLIMYDIFLNMTYC